jgi:hypothetical protein
MGWTKMKTRDWIDGGKWKQGICVQRKRREKNQSEAVSYLKMRGGRRCWERERSNGVPETRESEEGMVGIFTPS